MNGKNKVYSFWVNVPECYVTTKEQEKREDEEKEGERKYLKETELDKLPFPLMLLKRIEFMKNNFLLPHTKMQSFLQIVQISEIEQHAFQ